MGELPFENLSGLVGLQVVSANSVAELQAVLTQIRLPCRILHIYADGGRHHAWIRTMAKIKKQAIKSKETQ